MEDLTIKDFFPPPLLIVSLMFIMLAFAEWISLEVVRTVKCFTESCEENPIYSVPEIEELIQSFDNSRNNPDKSSTSEFEALNWAETEYESDDSWVVI